MATPAILRGASACALAVAMFTFVGLTLAIVEFFGFIESMEFSMDQAIALALFVLLFVVRYLRTVVGIFTYLLYKPKRIAANPKFTANDVTVIVPTTFKTPSELVSCITRCLDCQPHALFVVTSDANVDLVKDCCLLNGFESSVTVLGVDRLNKREQMLKAIPYTTTDIFVFADDDVCWPDNTYLDRLLAIFEDDKVGAGGTRQRVRRDNNPSIWNMLGISYLERRVFNNATTNAIDGSISTLSGRTSAYRAEILRNEDFYYYFRNDKWRGKPLNSDDDKCLTRYVYSLGWKICLQFDPKAVLETTVEGDMKYLSQCLRWARAHWRGNFTVMENETYWRSSTYWWGAYVIYFGQFFTPAIAIEGALFGLLYYAINHTEYAKGFYLTLAAWIFFTKNVKMIPHFLKYPLDMKFIPFLVAFSYFHGFLNIYAACTMTTTHWGSQNLTALESARATGEEEIVPLLVESMDTEMPGVTHVLEQIVHGPEDSSDPYGVESAQSSTSSGDNDSVDSIEDQAKQRQAFEVFN